MRLMVFLLFMFNVSLCLAQANDGGIMVIKMTNKYPEMNPDTTMKVWMQGNILKMQLARKRLVITGTTNGNGGFDYQTNPVSQQDNDTTQIGDAMNRTTYVRDFNTGEALDIIYKKGQAIVWKRKETTNIPIDSTDKIWLKEKKTVAGHPCRKLILVNKVSKIRDTVFVAMDIKGIKNPSYTYLNYFPMEYADKNYRYQVKQVEPAKLSALTFAIPAGAKVFTDRQEWLKYLFVE